ncbi:30S ribosomal protein S17 [Candidatus Cytomitobacter indipagum]|uniref:Small ribosomal subunit protein uS17 n=1 Tax=Candidatus Cytomitobacter indipagum TaxID=2601575 RepID=A0A5C0UDY6_9PROT|nr:30S ribosomal protein S17 [Candidatus Cytomitobacter indipagum]QEK38238.1 30S ribosomal protein S17 [Candidatus Cytomitobacter indipagum]
MTKYISGKVVSCSSDKTVSVLVKRIYKHPIYGSVIKRSKKFMIHDPQNVCKVGDFIKAKSCAPISKRKSWCLVEDKS